LQKHTKSKKRKYKGGSEDDKEEGIWKSWG